MALHNALRSEQNGCRFEHNIFNYIFVEENLCILVQIRLTFVLKGLIDNELALIQVMAWYQTGNRPFTEPLLIKIHDAIWRH